MCELRLDVRIRWWLKPSMWLLIRMAKCRLLPVSCVFAIGHWLGKRSVRVTIPKRGAV